jgi:polysaccharide deacetylase family protein (PEP-CTERM system associated)
VGRNLGAVGTLLLSVDFEDWHQLARRRVGASGWEQPGPALARQTEALLALLDELGVRATFFVLGMAARAHPQLVSRVVDAGHEIGCHGDAHVRVFSQTRAEFAADLRAARETIERLTGQAPVGYRAPAFSITLQTPWAYEVLAEEGFEYDASEHDTPRNRDRVATGERGPHPVGALWEFPVAVWRAGLVTVPVGGASYWAVMPRELVLHGLEQAGELSGLYLHPYELDPQPLRLLGPPGTSLGTRGRGALRAAQRNIARRGSPDTLRAIAKRFRLIPYGEAHAERHGSTAARS